jgi:hypothetical protein
VGPTRDFTENASISTQNKPFSSEKSTSETQCIGIDVIFNDKLIEIALKNSTFRAQIVELSLEWIAKETKLKFDMKFQQVEGISYKGWSFSLSKLTCH